MRIPLLTLTVVLLLALTACYDTPDETAAPSAAVTQAPPPLDKDVYRRRVAALNEAVEAYLQAGQAWVHAMRVGTDPELVRPLLDGLRNSKHPFEDMARLADPPAGYAQAHARLAQTLTRLAACINEQTDVLTALIAKKTDFATLTQRTAALEKALRAALQQLDGNMQEINALN